MKLSVLQKYILRKVYVSGKARFSRQALLEYYRGCKIAPANKMQVKIITQSLERLIDKGLIIGYGHKTQEKFFIQEIKLTAAGKRAAKQSLGKQDSLPFKIKHKRNSRYD